jgi:hypothetical protein
VKALSAENEAKLGEVEELLEDLCSIARNPGKTDFAIFVPGLLAAARAQLEQLSSLAQFAFRPELAQAAEDHAKLAALNLKLIHAWLGELARDDWLATQDTRHEIGKLRLAQPEVTDQVFAEAWNQPRHEGDSQKDRAVALWNGGKKPCYGPSVQAIEQRAYRLRRRGIPMGGGRAQRRAKRK